jgi:multidrug efflux pump subunit AcrA (membrane-fusion protein)
VIRMANLNRKHETISPERTALAQAIEAARAAKAARDAAIRAEEPAMQAQWQARDVLEAAEAALREAKADGVKRAQGALTGGNVLEASTSVRAARGALTDAQDALDEATAARDGLNASRDSDDRLVSMSRFKVDEAKKALLRAEALPAGMALVAEVAELQRQLAAKGGALMWLMEQLVFPQREGYSGWHPMPADEAVRTVFYNFGKPPTTWDEWNSSSGAAEWRAAYEALGFDASVKFPG